MSNIVALSGSLRTGSYNTALLRAAAELSPDGMTIALHDYSDVPLYNADIEEPTPAAVAALRQAITDADGLLIATPEYNFSIPGVLKNAIDWASRPAFKGCLVGKHVAICSASPAGVGGARAKQHLKAILLGCLCDVYPSNEVIVSRAHQAFTDGVLTDERTRGYLAKFLAGYATRLG